VTDDQVVRAQKLRSKGMSYREMSIILDVPATTLGYHLNAAYREGQKDYRALYNPLYKATHKEATRVYNAEYRKTHEEYYKDYAKAYDPNYYEVHKEHHRALGKQWRKDHKEELRLYEEARRKKRAPRHNMDNARRRALKRGALIGATVAQLAEIKEIYQRAKEASKVRCYLCGKLIPEGHRHVDHIVPISKGGAHRPSNLAVACDTCNLSKHNKSPAEIGLLL